MQKYFAIIKAGFDQQLTYRMAMIAGLVTNIFFGILRISVMVALYGDKTMVNGMSLDKALSFICLSQGLISFMELFGSYELMRSVYDGSITNELIHPYSLFNFYLFKEIGKSMVNLLGRSILLFVLLSLLFAIFIPSQLITWLFFVISILIGWFISYCWRFLVNLAAFWSPDARGWGRLLFGLSQLCCGFFIPLRLLPDWFSKIVNYTPFPAMLNIPMEIFLQITPNQEIPMQILSQVLWAGVLFLLVQIVYSLGYKRLIILGG